MSTNYFISRVSI